MLGRVGRVFLSLGVALLIAGGATAGMAWLWVAIGGGAMSVHGWIGLGMAGTTGLAWALMALAFRSDRDGWDDRVDNSLDPGRETAGDPDPHA